MTGRPTRRNRCGSGRLGYLLDSSARQVTISTGNADKQTDACVCRSRGVPINSRSGIGVGRKCAPEFLESAGAAACPDPAEPGREGYWPARAYPPDARAGSAADVLPRLRSGLTSLGQRPRCGRAAGSRLHVMGIGMCVSQLRESQFVSAFGQMCAGRSPGWWAFVLANDCSSPRAMR